MSPPLNNTTNAAKAATNIRQQVDVCIGHAGTPVGSLTYVKQGQRENTAFAYGTGWLVNPERFEISPELALTADYQQRKALSKNDSPFHHALADTAPDAWGRRVIARAHAKRRRSQPELGALTELDYLLAVDDFSRVGALRLRDAQGKFLHSSAEGERSTPALIELQHMLSASRAVELGKETAQDLRYLQGKGTSLGGMRPKCTVVDDDGRLAIGKFPSVGDSRSVTRGEVLAMRLAQLAGIDAAPARIVQVDGLQDMAVAIIGRFDRTPDGKRIPYLSAASMLQASRDEERSYFEITDAIRAHCAQPSKDLQQLWRRMLFNLLVTNVDDHLQNHGFLHVGRGQWRLAPAFDINPFPDKDRESKTWLSEQDGPIVDVATLLARCTTFALSAAQAQKVLAEVSKAVAGWRALALSPEVGLKPDELEDFAPAFEHAQTTQATAFSGKLR
jgi:serine/threonine-protein kinase HipA